MSDDFDIKRRNGARFTEQSVQNILEFSPGLACCYRDGRILAVNSAGAAMLGYDDRTSLEGRMFEDLLPHDYAGMDLIEQVLEDKMPCLAMMRQADGTKLRVEIQIQLARELGPGTLIIRAEDISSRVFLGSDIQNSEMRFRDLVDNAIDLICSCSDGKITFINRSGLALVGTKNPDEIIGMPVSGLFHPDYLEVFTEPEILLELMREKEPFPARFARQNGTCIDVHIAITPSRIGSDFMLEARDITAHRNAVMALHQMNQDLELRVQSRTQELTDEVARRKETEEQLRQTALHDGLTGLPNRQLLMERLDHALRRAHRDQNMVAVIFIDLDGFKSVNDTHGHDAGDALLKSVSSQLLRQVRETDTVARLGGDEFIIAYTEINTPQEATLLSQQILDALTGSQSMVNDQKIDVGASIGIALYPEHGQSGEDLIKAADEAMYDVKKRGKNSYSLAVGKS